MHSRPPGGIVSEIRPQATTAKDELAGEIGLEIMEVVVDLTGGYKPDGERDHNRIEKGARAILALLKPRTVNSEAELDSLPVGSVVWTQALIPGPVGHIFVKCAGMWIIPWHDAAEDPLEKNGSVTVLFTPGGAG